MPSFPLSRPAATLSVLAGLSLLGACQAQLDVDLSASAPAGVEAVTLAAPYVDLEDSDGGFHSFDSASDAAFDLLDFADGSRQSLISENDAAATYTGVRVRFDVDAASVTRSDGTQFPLTLAAQPDYADVDLHLGDSDSATLVLTLELPFSLVDRSASEGDYELRPVLRAARADEAGELNGTIAKSLVEAEGCRAGRSAGSGVAVYLYEGSDVTPGDYFRSDSVVNLHQPVASAAVAYSATDEAYAYAIYHLAPGTYTAAWTCQADAEQPEVDDGLVFQDAGTVTISSGDTATLDF